LSEIRIREALPADFPALRECLAQVFLETASQKANEFGEALWNWQYLQNPTGSVVVIAEDDGLICGYYHALLLPTLYHGRPATAALVQDVGTRASHRMHGIFKRVGVFADDVCRRRGAFVVYGFPNERSIHSFMRNQAWKSVAQVPVYLLPLDLGPLFANHFRIRFAGNALGGLLNLPYRTLFTKTKKLRPNEQMMAIAQFGDDITRPTREFATRVRVGLDRTKSYLNWRFIQKPNGGYAAWGIYRGGQLLAYTITRPAKILGSQCTMFMDFGCLNGEEGALGRLISERVLAERSVGSALAVAMGLHPAFDVFLSLGFRKVPERFNPRTFNLLCKELQGETCPDLFDATSWMTTLADWDVY
jgi:GNAT acetyltransferase-like protein